MPIPQRLRYGIRLLLFFAPLMLECPSLLAQVATVAFDEQAIIRKLESLDLQLEGTPKAALQEIDTIFRSLDRTAMPRAWLRAYIIASAAGRQGQEMDLDRLFSRARENQDHEAILQLQFKKFTAMKNSASRAAMLSAFQEALALACDDVRDRLYCGKIWAEIAMYHTNQGSPADGIRAIEKSMQILQDITGPQSVHYYKAREAFANFLLDDNQLHRAEALFTENYKWFLAQGIIKLAGISAYNVTNTIMRPKTFDIAKAQTWAGRTLALGQKLDDSELLGAAHYLNGKLLMLTSRYQEASHAFAQASRYYSDDRDLVFAAASQIFEARAWVALHEWDVAESRLREAEKLLSPDNRYDRMSILDVRHEMALQKADYQGAHSYLQQLFEAWKADKAEEMQKESQRISAQLGLQVEEERNKTLRQENELQAQKLKEPERIRIFTFILGLLSMSTISLLVLSLRQNKKILRSQREIQMILDHMDEGLLTLGPQQTIGPNHSRLLPQMIEAHVPLADHDFVTSVFASSQLPAEQQSIIREILSATLGEERVAWDMNSANLPSEFRRGHSIFTLRWIPIFDHHDILRRVLVILSDVTQARALEEVVGHQERRLRALPETLRELLQVKRDLLEEVLQRTETTLQHLDAGQHPQSRMRELHTQKGLARTLGLRSLSQALHELESQLGPHAAQNPSQVKAHVQETHERIQEYRAFAQILYQGHDEASVGHGTWLASAIEPHLGQWLERLRQEQFSFHQIRVIDSVLQWPQALIPVVRDLCLHAINNSLDHGFILPRQRGEVVEQPVIEVSACVESGHLKLEVCDNGIGLNQAKLASIAKAKGFIPQGHENIFDVVFHDGVSTVDQITMTSGRGVGLAAVKAAVLERGGSIGIHPRASGHGTVLWATLPWGGLAPARAC